MYEKFFGVRERPFDLTANPKFLFLTPSHREALGNLEYAIGARNAITVVIGEAGVGKTTVIRAYLESGGDDDRLPVCLSNPTLTRSEFLEFLAGAFDLPCGDTTSKTRVLSELEKRLLHYRDAGVTPALIIDEAQALSQELLEEIRLLTNIETTTEKLLPIILAGQPELAERLNQQDLRQLKQRVGLRCELRPLSLNETASYVASRIRIAGGDAARLFTRDAVIFIHERSGGIPRTIGVICHNALIGGFALNKSPVGVDLVREVCRDFDLDAAVTRWAAESRTDGVPPDESPDSLVGPAPPEPAAIGAARGGELFAAVMRRRRGVSV